MSRGVSVGTMVKQISGLLDTSDLIDWENRFVGDIAQGTQDGQRTETLTEKQIEVIERIWKKHFA